MFLTHQIFIKQLVDSVETSANSCSNRMIHIKKKLDLTWGVHLPFGFGSSVFGDVNQFGFVWFLDRSVLNTWFHIIFI